MFRPKRLFPILLLGAMGVPYLLSNGGPLSSLKDKCNGLFTDSSRHDAAVFNNSDVALPVTHVPGPDGQMQTVIPRLVGPDDVDMHDVFHFGVTPDWIMSRWSRVSTTLADLELEGMRVPLVTGSQLNDIHGSLTYYFDRYQQLQRITFHGQTGDASKLILLLTQQHGFDPQPSLSAGVYLKKWNGRPTGVLWIEHAPLVRATSPRTRLDVTLEINSTLGSYKLSRESAQMLQQRKLAGKW